MRIPTDVIPVGEIQPACSAGSPITRVGKTGTLTLIFENLHPKASEKSYLAFTAAHVAGDLTLPRPVNPFVWSSCCNALVPFGEIVVSSTRSGSCVEYDIALIALDTRAGTSCELHDRGTRFGTTLSSFYPPSAIGAGMLVSCDFPVSNTISGNVISGPGTVYLPIAGRECAVGNAYTLRAPVRAGDSGGLLFSGDRAVGILFGQSPQGWGWFHALAEAAGHLARLPTCPEFQVFPDF